MPINGGTQYINRLLGLGVCREARRARLIKQVYEMDPLACPRCTGPMRLIACIEQPEVIEKILTHLGIWPVQAHSPPAGVPVAISPATGLLAV
jgi:hypothetical protein